ncbi:MAG: small subunit ribosomal protein [Pyrinomonadaceae bacterium]|nr:small subunit ribosomal protein [Pyrinomonadaceae bacterium]
MAEKRIYEVVFIIDPATGEEDSTRLVENLQKIVTDQGGAITKSESMGRRQLAYRIGRNTEGHFMLFEIEGTGGEIAELERRMRVSDQVMRYLTVRVDEDRRRADKFKDRRIRKASKRPEKGSGGRAGGGGGNFAASSAAPAAVAVAAAPVAVADEEDAGA